jgi:hypothetical protein
MTEDTFIAEVKTLLATKEVEVAKLERRLARDRERFEALTQDMDALRQTLAVYRKHHRLPDVETESDQVIDPALANLTARDVVLELARLREGRLIVAEAAKILVRVGISATERLASSNIYSAISHHGPRFRKLRPGVYELLEARPGAAQTQLDLQGATRPAESAQPIPLRPTMDERVLVANG